MPGSTSSGPPCQYLGCNGKAWQTSSSRQRSYQTIAVAPQIRRWSTWIFPMYSPRCYVAPLGAACLELPIQPHQHKLKEPGAGSGSGAFKGSLGLFRIGPKRGSRLVRVDPPLFGALPKKIRNPVRHHLAPVFSSTKARVASLISACSALRWFLMPHLESRPPLPLPKLCSRH